MVKASFASALSVGVALVVCLPGLTRADDKPTPLQEELLKLNRVTGDTAQRTKLIEFVKDKDKAKKGVKEAVRMMKAATDEKPFNFNGALILAKAGHFLKQYEDAEYLYEYLVESATKLKSGGKMLQAYEGLIDMYWDARRYDSVVDTCEKFVELKGPEEIKDALPFVLERMIQAKAKLGQTDEALKMTEGLIQLDDGGWYFVQLKGWVLREAGKTEAAIEAYTDALNKLDAARGLKDDIKDRMKDRIRYIMSGLYVDVKEIDKAARQLQTLIKRNPDNPTYKNDLGYIWADNEMNLDESAKLVREAIDLDRKRQEKAKAAGELDEVRPNAAYLDSLGWVLYKQKNYKDALTYLKQATADEEEGNHMEIWDHLADCYLAMGQTKDAIATWEKALKLEDVSPRDKARRRLVTEKLRKARTTLKSSGD